MSIRKALLVGINAYPVKPLRGCINDVVRMKDLLKCFYGFADDGFCLLLDEQATYSSVVVGLEWLAQGGSDPDAVRIFHFSGHGTYIADTNGDEPDGRDECLVPVDFETAGLLPDDTLKALYDQFPRAGNLTLVMDCCHSGSTNLAPGDKRYRFLPITLQEQERIDAAARKYVEERAAFVAQQIGKASSTQLSGDETAAAARQISAQFEKSRFGDIRNREANILLAACRPDQQAADARIGSRYHGAFTYFLADVIAKAKGHITYYNLVSSVAQALYTKEFVQIPQLEARGQRGAKPAFMPF